MDIQGTEEKAKQVDSLLATLKSILKKHWGLLLLILFCYFIYWALTTEPSLVEESVIENEQIQEEYQQKDLPVDYVTDSSYVEEYLPTE